MGKIITSVFIPSHPHPHWHWHLRRRRMWHDGVILSHYYA